MGASAVDRLSDITKGGLILTERSSQLAPTANLGSREVSINEEPERHCRVPPRLHSAFKGSEDTVRHLCAPEGGGRLVIDTRSNASTKLRSRQPHAKPWVSLVMEQRDGQAAISSCVVAGKL